MTQALSQKEVPKTSSKNWSMFKVAFCPERAEPLIIIGNKRMLFVISFNLLVKSMTSSRFEFLVKPGESITLICLSDVILSLKIATL